MRGTRRFRFQPERWMLVLALLLVAPGGLVAQQRGGPPPGREELQRRLQARFGQIVSVHLGLDRDEQEALAAVLRETERERRELLARQRALRERIRERVSIVPTDSPAPLLPDAEARTILEDVREIRRAEQRLQASEEERLLGVLTPAQLLRFYALREHLTQRIRRLRDGPGRGGGPGDPGWTRR